MSAKILEGGPIAEQIKDEIRAEIEQMAGPPRLVAVMAGDNAGARMYAKMQAKSCEEVGIAYELKEFGEDISEADLLGEIQKLNEARKGFVAEQMKELVKDGKETFDSAIIAALRKQAESRKFQFEENNEPEANPGH